MPQLSIVACRIFEDELMHVLTLNNAFDYLFIIDTVDSQDLIRRLKQKHINFTVSAEDKIAYMLDAIKTKGLISLFKKNIDKFTVIVHLMELGLHTDPQLLRNEVYKKIEHIASYSDGILLFYGLCGNSLKNVEAELSHLQCPLFFLKDNENARVEDCISTALGGNYAYEKAFELCRGKGTIFFTPMWASNWKAVDKKNNISSDINKLTNSFKKQHIEKIIKINTSGSYNRHFEEHMEQFAKHFQLDIADMPGNMNIAEKSFMEAKKQTIFLKSKK